ncbi:hypothetical protein CPB83DRAFT_93772 [Crepidotus variabilis]|uniref:Uncharacterized protein n=1 Tax=Crepidotus variabilis TaxID=179855 RepID=A0A9P6E4X8_9AGAR|nr:hypothetical protein CPB83DRAFT_93772 [Crepidotus variabilis]
MKRNWSEPPLSASGAFPDLAAATPHFIHQTMETIHGFIPRKSQRERHVLLRSSVHFSDYFAVVLDAGYQGSSHLSKAILLV